MKRLFKLDKPTLLRWTLFIGAVAAMSYFFPREDKFSYEYALGKPWTYSLLTAPFDMPINIDSVTAAKEKDSINSRFVPIYLRNPKAKADNTNRLKADLADNTHIPAHVKNQIINLVNKLYDDGIIDSDAAERISAGKLPNVRFIVNNVAENTATDNLRSVRQSYQWLDSIDKHPEYQAALNRIQITNYLAVNVRYDSIESNRMLDQLYQKALAPTGILQKGERIIDRGDRVSPQSFQLLQTYERMMSDQSQSTDGARYPLIGQILIVTLLFACFYSFMFFFRPRTFADNRRMLFLTLFMVVFTCVSFVIAGQLPRLLYLIPFAAVAIVVTTFFDSRTAFFANIIVVLLCALAVPYPLEFICLQIIAGTTAITSIQQLTKRSQLIQCAFYIFIAYCLTYTGLEIINEGTILHVNIHMIGTFAMNAIVLSFVYVLIFLIEKSFGFISPVSLVEISDVNSPLLRELSEKCPGTFQHSLQVSNLASEAAHRIGANVQLVRAGALIHDIGKIDNPAFFTENQRGVNPHNALTPQQSAHIVVSHVADGLRRADKAKLPDVLKAFILQHHGHGKARYFYSEACRAQGADNVDPAPFTYPGPNPNTKETAILMMADATEAASKSLSDHSDAAIKAIVNKIIDTQIAEGMFNDSPISFKDITVIKSTFTERLCTFYHTRVSYPETESPNGKTGTNSVISNS